MLDEPARRGLVVIGRDGDEAVRAELVRLLGEMDGVRGAVGAASGEYGRPAADGVDRDAEQLKLLCVGKGR